MKRCIITHSGLYLARGTKGFEWVSEEDFRQCIIDNGEGWNIRPLYYHNKGEALRYLKSFNLPQKCTLMYTDLQKAEDVLTIDDITEEKLKALGILKEIGHDYYAYNSNGHCIYHWFDGYEIRTQYNSDGKPICREISTPTQTINRTWVYDDKGNLVHCTLQSNDKICILDFPDVKHDVNG